MCAQRRLASLDCSHRQSVNPSRPSLCSTPFGVIGLFTRAPQGQIAWLDSAQRRLASLDCSPRRPAAESRRNSGAQRRLASLDCSPWGRFPRRMPLTVLNAVWRHWIVHKGGEVSVEVQAKCSTPFGVIGLFTRLTVSAVHFGGSAQRRLASLDCSHAVVVPPRRSRARCSTPFGVIGLFTPSIPRREFRPVCAQRRLASLDCSHATRFGDSLQAHVLNAVWRHWIVHTASRIADQFRELCSTPFGVIGLFTHPERPGRWGSFVCSTPFGVIGLFTPRELANAIRRRLCSTPFGVIGLFTTIIGRYLHER